MTNKIQLSVITPSFNGAQYIKDYLDSLIKNLPQDAEVIIVDNGSADETVEIIRKYHDVKLVENKINTGFGHANNQGGQIAKGEYLVFINQDITVYKNSLEQMLEYARNHPEVGI